MGIFEIPPLLFCYCIIFWLNQLHIFKSIYDRFRHMFFEEILHVIKSDPVNFQYFVSKNNSLNLYIIYFRIAFSIQISG